jgi:mannosyltransferase OCH1-like enzyme
MNKQNYTLIIIVVLLFIFLYINKTNVENFGVNKIPKIIIQTWKNDIIPNNYYNDIKSIMQNNKDYQFLFFNDDNIEDFLSVNYPHYYETYNKLPYKIQKIDFFRYIAVYHFGGFYFDLDMSGFLPLNDLLKHEAIFPVDTVIHDDYCNTDRLNEYCENNKIKINYLLGQYAFAAAKKNNFIKFIIDGIHNNINKYIENDTKDANFNREYYIYKTTGPDYVTTMYLQYNDKNSIHILDYYTGQYFGDYARHNHYGTWK